MFVGSDGHASRIAQAPFQIRVDQDHPLSFRGIPPSERVAVELTMLRHVDTRGVVDGRPTFLIIETLSGPSLEVHPWTVAAVSSSRPLAILRTGLDVDGDVCFKVMGPDVVEVSGVLFHQPAEVPPLDPLGANFVDGDGADDGHEMGMFLGDGGDDLLDRLRAMGMLME